MRTAEELELFFFGGFKGVVMPTSALGKYGLCHDYWGLDLQSKLIRTTAGRVRWYKVSVDVIDKENFVKPHNFYPGIVVPTPERALIDCIRMLDDIDEGLMVEAFGRYQVSERFNNLPELYKVADFYKVPKEDVDYWLKEGYNDLRSC